MQLQRFYPLWKKGKYGGIYSVVRERIGTVMSGSFLSLAAVEQ
jgi:hypothetical protein